MKPVILPSVVCAMLLAAAPSVARAQSSTPNVATPNLATPNVATPTEVTTNVTTDQPDYFGKDSVSQNVSFRQAKPRTRRQHIILASLLGGAVTFGGIGLYYHLDSRDASNEVTLAGGEPSRTYDSQVDATRDRAFRSRALAIVNYSIAGAFLVATVVALAMTQPGEEIVTVDESPVPEKVVPVSGLSTLSIGPVRGGAIIGKAWSF